MELIYVRLRFRTASANATSVEAKNFTGFAWRQ